MRQGCRGEASLCRTCVRLGCLGDGIPCIASELRKVKGQKGKVEQIEHTVEVTDYGVDEVQRITEETMEKIQERALEQVRQHFIANPENIPSPASVRRVDFIKVGGGSTS
jgi:hypothetical protein